MIRYSAGALFISVNKITLKLPLGLLVQTFKTLSEVIKIADQACVPCVFLATNSISRLFTSSGGLIQIGCPRMGYLYFFLSHLIPAYFFWYFLFSSQRIKE